MRADAVLDPASAAVSAALDPPFDSLGGEEPLTPRGVLVESNGCTVDQGTRRWLS